LGWGNAVSVCWCGRLCSNTCSDDAAAFYTAVDAAARAAKTTDPAESRTLDQLRADVVAALGWSALAAGHLGCCHPDCEHPNRRLGGRHGRAATVNVTVGYTTLIGADDQPAHLDGYGPITADVARRLAADGVWRRLRTDPATGAVLDVGATRYRPPADLADHVVARDRTCRFPTCTHPAAGCDLDHTIPHQAGGPTSHTNTGPLHRGHHVDKTHHRWQLSQPEAGRFIWTSPTGHSYQVEPEIVGLLAQPPPPEPEPVKPDPDATVLNRGRRSAGLGSPFSQRHLSTSRPLRPWKVCRAGSSSISETGVQASSSTTGPSPSACGT
jgi:hypothetical protein